MQVIIGKFEEEKDDSCSNATWVNGIVEANKQQMRGF